MTDGNRPVTPQFVQRLRRRPGFGGENILRRLTVADYLSLTALFFAWGAAVLFLSSEPNWAIVVTFVAILFDKLDGYYARNHGATSALGRRIDSFIDVFTYLVTAALLFHYALAPTPLVSVGVGFLIVSFGGLRLIRHTEEGFDTDGDTSYYVGTTVVHTHLLVLALYFLAAFLGPIDGWIAAVAIGAACPLMVSDYRSPKTTLAHVLVGLAGIAAIGLALVLEYGGA